MGSSRLCLGHPVVLHSPAVLGIVVCLVGTMSQRVTPHFKAHRFPSESAAEALFSSLTGAAPLCEGAASVVSLVHRAPKQTPASPVILEALARLVSVSLDAGDEQAARESAHALVILSGTFVRPWCALVRSGAVWNVPLVSRVVVDALCWPRCEKRWPLAEDLRLLCSGPAAKEIVERGENVSTPLAITVAVLLGDLRKSQRTNVDATIGTDGGVRNGLAACFAALIESLDATCWDFVSDDDFVELVGVLCDTSTQLGSAPIALSSYAVLRRLRTGFDRGTAAAGRLYAKLSRKDEISWPKLQAAVRDWPSVYGETPGFKAGYLACRMELSKSGVLSISEASDAEEFYAHVAGGRTSASEIISIADSFMGWSNEKYAPLLAAAYIASPDALRVRVHAAPSVMKAVPQIPVSLRGPIDGTLDTAVRMMIDHVGGADPIVRPPWVLDEEHQCDLQIDELNAPWQSTQTIEQAVIRVKRLALAHPWLVLRRAALLSGALEYSLLDPHCNKGGALNVQSGLLRILVALQSGVTIEGDSSYAIWAACIKAVRFALGEGRAKNGVHGTFGILAVDACDAMRGMLRVRGGRGCQSRWREDVELRKLLRAAESADGTEDDVRVAIGKLFS